MGHSRQRPNSLLDEPTNHIDLEMRHALALALQDFEGALVVVSHDRHLLRSVTDDLWLVADGKVEPFDGDLDDYRRWLLTRDREEAAAIQGSESKETQAHSAAAKKDRKREEAERRKRLQPLRQKVQKLEKEMEALQARKAKLDEQLADNSLYQEDAKDRLKELLQEQAEVSGRLETVEMEWLEASEEYELAEA